MSNSPIFARIEQDIKNNPVVLYMKGTKAFPQCGFSAAIAQILTVLNIEFVDFDVLADADLRQGIKDYTNWPTIPQLYVAGEFIGGCDIVRDMFETGELQALFQEKGVMAAA